MSSSSSNKASLSKGDVIVLKECISDGWWKCEVNGNKSKILISKFKDLRFRREKSDETHLSRSKQKKLHRETSSSSRDSSGSDRIIKRSHSNESATSPRLLSKSSPHLFDNMIVKYDNDSIPPAPPLPKSWTTKPSKKRTSLKKRASKLFLGSSGNSSSSSNHNSIDLKEVQSLIRSDSCTIVSTPKQKKTKDSSNKDDDDSSNIKRSKRGSIRVTKNSNNNNNNSGNMNTSNNRDLRLVTSNDLKDICIDIENVKIEIQLIIKALNEERVIISSNESNIYIDDRLPPLETPELKILNKMLEEPFTALFSTDGKEIKTDIVLAPSKTFLYKDILIPNININIVNNEEREILKTLDFDIFPYKDRNDENYTFILLMNMFYEFNLPKIFKISDATLFRFLYIISKRYRSVPFHNFYHAFNVTQTLYFFLTKCNAAKLLGPLEILALLIATIAHDCDHPGLNNDFQRKAQTKIYHMHKKSVLENHHYLQCMQMLVTPETNILSNLTQEQEDKFFIYLRDLILATDLAVHGIILKSLKERNKVLSKYYKTGQISSMNEEDRKLLMCALVKCSDLSNEVRKENMSKKWANLVIEEFLMQSKMERKMDMPLTPFMDSEKIIIAKEQINFIEKLCLPLYTQMAQIFPEMTVCCQTLVENKEKWLRRLSQFYTNDSEALKKLSDKSIWERDQIKLKGSNLSTTLAMRATNTLITTKKRPPYGGQSTNNVPVNQGNDTKQSTDS